jgi:hypothetical protein
LIASFPSYDVVFICLQQNGIEVLSYQDNAEATLEVLDNGSTIHRSSFISASDH